MHTVEIKANHSTSELFVIKLLQQSLDIGKVIQVSENPKLHAAHACAPKM